MDIRNWQTKLSTELKLANFADSTIKNYCSHLALFLARFSPTHKEPKEITTEEIKQYLLSLSSTSLRKQNIGTLTNFYSLVVGQKRKLDRIPYPRKERIIPEIFTREEVQTIIKAIPNKKHKAMIALIYSTGMRISEPINLRLTDVHSKESVAHIRGAKGHKDRIVPIPSNVMELLIRYYKQYQPKEFFFEGVGGGQYAKRSVTMIFKRACRKAGIKRVVKIHTLRHSFATHHIEDGTSDSVLMELMGHNSQKTLQIYKHLSRKFLSSYASPAARMNFE